METLDGSRDFWLTGSGCVGREVIMTALSLQESQTWHRVWSALFADISGCLCSANEDDSAGSSEMTVSLVPRLSLQI